MNITDHHGIFGANGGAFPPPAPPHNGDEDMKVLISVITGVALAIIATALAFCLTNIFVAVIVTGIAWCGALGNGLISFLCCCGACDNTTRPPLGNNGRHINHLPQTSAFGVGGYYEPGRAMNTATAAPVHQGFRLPYQAQPYPLPLHTNSFAARAQVGSQLHNSSSRTVTQATGAPIHQGFSLPQYPMPPVNPNGTRAPVGRKDN